MNDYISKPVDPALLLDRLSILSANAAPVRQPAVVIDKARLEGLDKVLRKPELDSFVELFLTDLENQRGEIRKAVENKQDQQAAKICQTLATASENLGAVQLDAAVKHLHEACRSSQTDAIQTGLVELNRAARATDTALRMWLADRKHLTRQSA